MKRIRSLISNFPSRYLVQSEDLRIHEKSGHASVSGVNATVFGASSHTGSVLVDTLAKIGSRCIIPYRSLEHQTHHKFKSIRAMVDVGYKAAIWLSDFTDEKELMLTMRDQNAVICCIGNKFYCKRDEEFELSNILVPRAIAKSVKQSPSVKRYALVFVR